MNFAIFSIDDSRKHYTDRIRSQLGESFWFNEVGLKSCNANDELSLAWYKNMYQYRVDWQGGQMRKGHLGIWYTVINAVNSVYSSGTPLVHFEDDAELHPAFNSLFWEVTTKLPKDTDAFSLFLPRDQDDVYRGRASELNVSFGICKAYQVYGGVSMLWTPQGANKFLGLLARDGIQDQWDNQLYQYARNNEMNVYTQTPTRNVMVGISGNEESIVQESEFI